MSDEQRFQDPKITIIRVYTKTGDAGETRLVGGQMVPKDEIRIESYGTIDDLNSWLGKIRSTLDD